MRRTYYIGQAVTDHIGIHRVYYFVFFITAILGIIIGIISGNNMSSTVSITINNINNITLNRLLSGNFTGGSFFLNNSATIVAFSFIIIVVNINVIFMPANYILIAYRGYLIGYNSFLIVKVFNAGGIFNLIIFFLPEQIVLLVCLVAVSAVAARRCVCNCRYGLWCFRNVEYRQSLICIIFIVFASIILYTILALILPLISSGV